MFAFFKVEYLVPLYLFFNIVTKQECVLVCILYQRTVSSTVGWGGGSVLKHESSACDLSVCV